METCKSGSEGGRWKRTVTYLASCLPYIEMVTLYQGSVNCAQVRVAEVFQAAIQRNARSILLAHNHPSSDLSPSPEDVALTRAVVQAGHLLDISVVDHLVIGKSGFVSLRERGLGFS